MKKQLLSVLGALALGTAVAQPSASWNISQNAAFTNTSVGIRFMDAVDQNSMWVIGYDGFQPNRNYNWFSRTTNGGNSFNTGVVFTSTLTPSIGDTTTYQISNLCGIDANTAWVCAFGKAAPQGGGVIYKTTNGGLNWNNATPAGMFAGSTAFGNFVSFLTPSVGIVNGDPVSGEYELWRTIDGGLSWSQVPGANIPNPQANEFAIVDLYAKQGTSNLWFATNQGRMYRTSDAGVNWSVSTVCPPTNTVTEIAFASPLNGVVYAVNGAGTFLMYNTTDGGVTWNPITPVSANVGRNDIVSIPGTGVYASCGAGTGNTIISFSNDNGVTWTDWGSVGIQYLTMDFVNSTTGWAGSFSNNVDPSVEGIWKYSGPAIGGTVTPTAAFTIPSYICGPNGNINTNNVSTGSGALSFTWAVSPAATIATPNTSNTGISFTGNNTYTVTLTASSALGTNVSSQVIQVLNCTPPVASFTMQASACNNAAVTATNTSIISPAASYVWSTSPSGGVTYPNSNTATTPVIKFATPGVYTVTVVASNISGTAAATQTITITDCTANASTFTLGTVAEGCAGLDNQGLMSTATATAYFPGHIAGNSYQWLIVPSTSVTPFVYGPSGRYFEFQIPGTYTVTLVVTNVSGVSAPASKTVQVLNCTDGGVGIAENNNLSANVSIFPNPAHDVVNISVPVSGSDVYKVKLINVIGAVVYEEKISKENFSINLAGKAKGVYFLSIENNTQKAVKKIVIE